MGSVCVGSLGGFRTCDQLSYYDCARGFGCATQCLFDPKTFCGSVQNSIDCYSVNGCYWNGGFCAGVLLTSNVSTPCSYFSNETCNLWPGCSMIQNSTCYDQGCPDIFNFGTCIAKGCYWLFGNCVVPTGSGILAVSKILLMAMLFVFMIGN